MVYTLGESLLDIIFTSPGDIAARPGGGMLNTAVSLGRCGTEVSLISELGDDETARIIIDFLQENSVDSKHIKKYYHQNTSVAIAFLNEKKVPSFSIHKSYPDQRRLICPQEFSDGDILFFGSLYSLDKKIRSQVLNILVRAKQGGAMICYDPNIRRHNLNDPAIKQALIENISMSDLIKASEEDLQNIFGEWPDDAYLGKIRELNPEAVFFLTRGEKGAIGFKNDVVIDLPARKIEVLSTIGAGDAFNAGIVYALNRLPQKDRLAKNTLEEIMKSGIEFSAEVCGTMDNYVPNNYK
jgi:fructokinase